VRLSWSVGDSHPVIVCRVVVRADKTFDAEFRDPKADAPWSDEALQHIASLKAPRTSLGSAVKRRLLDRPSSHHDDSETLRSRARRRPRSRLFGCSIVLLDNAGGCSTRARRRSRH